MGIFTKLAQQIFASVDENGNARSISEQDAAVWGTELERAVSLFISSGGLIYPSKAALDADLAKPANSMAWVLGDTVAENNGVYRKSGATSPPGWWSRVSDLPYSFIIASDAGAGTPDAIQATTAIPVSASALVWMNIADTNSASPVTVSFNGGPALTVKSNAGNDIVAGGLTAGMIVLGIVSGSTFRLLSDQVSAALLASVESLYADFARRYLPASASDYATDLAGGALTEGALYFNTSTGLLRIYHSGAWQNQEAAVADGDVTFPKLDAELKGAVAPLRGFNANGTNSDEANFTALQGALTGRFIDGKGLNYAVTSFKTGNYYYNLNQIIGGVSYRSESLNGLKYLSIGEDHSGKGLTYPGPTGGRTTAETVGDFCVQGCFSGYIRSGSAWSIYCKAEGNNAVNVAARLSWAIGPQSFNAATEEHVSIGFGSAGIAVAESEATGPRNLNAAGRYNKISGRNAVIAGAQNCRAGNGTGARLSATVVGGVITAINVVAGGTGFTVAPTIILISDLGGNGNGAAATVNISGGAVTSVTVTNGGSGYSSSENIRIFLESDGDDIAIVSSLDTSASADLTTAFSSQLMEMRAVGSWGTGRRGINNTVRTGIISDSGSGAASTANRKHEWLPNGNYNLSGTVSSSHAFSDFAEIFENLKEEEIPLGSLVTMKGGKVCLTSKGDVVLGAVSKTAVIVAGDTQFTWAGRYMLGEFGEVLYHEVPSVRWKSLKSYKVVGDDLSEEVIRPGYDGIIAEAGDDIPDDAEFYDDLQPIENPDYDPSVENVPRSQRPKEHSTIGLLGQVYLRVAADVEPDDFLIGGDNGMGEKAVLPDHVREIMRYIGLHGVQVMSIKIPFMEEKGYAVARCFIR